MNRMRSLGVVGLVGAAALTGCTYDDSQLKQEIAQLKTEVQELQNEKQMLREYLKEGGELFNYMMAQSVAICELEKRTPGLDNSKRICPGTPPDIKPPPSYPPR